MPSFARALAAIVALVAIACAARGQSFTSAESGYVAAQYDAVIAGDVVGDVKVWSSGAFGRRGAGRALVHVGFDLACDAEAAIELPPHEVVIELATRDGVVRGPIELWYQDGDGRVPAATRARVDLWFALPPGVEPQDLDAFQVRWSVRSAEGRYAQRTPFTEYALPPGFALADTAYYYHSPWYDPFLYAPPLRSVAVVHPFPYYYHRRAVGPRRGR